MPRLTRVIIGVAVHLSIVLLFNKLFCIFISNFLCPSFLLSYKRTVMQTVMVVLDLVLWELAWGGRVLWLET